MSWTIISMILLWCITSSFSTLYIALENGFESSPDANSWTTLSTSIELHPGVLFMFLLLISFLILYTPSHFPKSA